MKELFTFIKNNRGNILTILLFLTSWIFITFLLPKETKFKYEFQKGKPWLHNNLIATYDFPIFKLPQEINEEKDSILQKFIPFFKIDHQAEQEMLGKFQFHFNRELSLHKKKEYNLQLNKIPHRIYNKLRELALGDMQLIYTKGVLPPIKNINDEFELIVVRDNYVEQLDNKNVFSQKRAYQFINTELNNFYYNHCNQDSSILKFIKKLDPVSYIITNLIFDEATTNKLKQNKIEQLSHTKGMVQNGQTIVAKGEMVDDLIFRKLYSIKKEFETETNALQQYWVILGQLLLVAVCLFILYQYVAIYRPNMIEQPNNTLFILLCIVASMVITTSTLHFDMINVYIIPYIIIPILIKNFFDTTLALISHIVNIILIGFVVPNSFEFLFIQLTTGFIGMYYLNNFHRRRNLTATAGIVFFVYILTYTAYALIQEGDITSINYTSFLWFLANSTLILISFPAIYIFEKTFGFVSELTLIELGDVNHPLLRKLAEKAPGTFQHSLQVANLGESAAFKVPDANPLLIRTGALYHDIGKIVTPQYFVENQISGFNPHDKLAFDESAEIIIGHVTKGVEIAKKHGLPNMVIDFIKSHHGTSKAQYFYRMYQNQFPDQTVKSEKFTYSGPKPNSKETAILMMADAVEAASRSLREISEHTISGLINKIITFQISEEQFSEANITFKDITIIKSVFLHKLLNIYHARIEYPEAKKIPKVIP